MTSIIIYALGGFKNAILVLVLDLLSQSQVLKIHLSPVSSSVRLASQTQENPLQVAHGKEGSSQCHKLLSKFKNTAHLRFSFEK